MARLAFTGRTGDGFDPLRTALQSESYPALHVTYVPLPARSGNLGDNTNPINGMERRRPADKSGLAGSAPVPQFVVMMMVGFTGWPVLGAADRGSSRCRRGSCQSDARGEKWTVDFGGIC